MNKEFVGKTINFEYEGFVVNDTFDETHIHYEVLEGPFKGLSGKVEYTAKQISEGVYAISWQEDDGATVTHVDDFNKGTSLSFFTAADLSFYRMEGKLSQVN